MHREVPDTADLQNRKLMDPQHNQLSVVEEDELLEIANDGSLTSI